MRVNLSHEYGFGLEHCQDDTSELCVGCRTYLNVRGTKSGQGIDLRAGDTGGF